ncbi:Mrp/NBP35 family ATP-binding protein [Actinotignum urinale]|uniref:Iron-sulfur cluster carrier protein n=1 Tax=Actinotignum urinale TaxID=190146 RepID=A0ABU5G557_9ACTO|nr:Mrp/NBP35 family ATP-binding protein [Actinotignum urinale]MDY5132501.1 Mrp/NBP35 family ATP-binding protein [Actinotignum urinale]MDY5159947.1 Mrp/NBP35 family ATP-binding protein [Actinotignum urinale]WIK58694.1 Mrp/NBP35 family ATP-binding protein [Actinotignum urinale]
MVTREHILKALSSIIDPELRHPITELDMVHRVTITDTGKVEVTILLTTARCPRSEEIEREVREKIESLGVTDVHVTMGVMTGLQIQKLQEKLKAGRATRNIPFAKENSPTYVIAIASGKGGVGKSTVAANLAVTLAKKGASVGLIDADIYGFSIPSMLGVDTPAQQLNGMIIPPVAHGIKIMSIGMFVPDGSPVVWRGPMLHKALEQFFADVYWGDLDFIILDLPPGTGDVTISISQLLPYAHILVVTTPQTAAADVALRAGSVSKQTEQKTVGVVENMSYMEMPDGTRNYIFGKDGGKNIARKLTKNLGYDIPLLAQIPFETDIREGGDVGEPFTLDIRTSRARKEFEQLADYFMKTRQTS